MSDPARIKSANQLPFHQDWQRYETPTVLRRYGRQFLERGTAGAEDCAAAERLAALAAAFGGECHTGEAACWLIFAELEPAIACVRRLQDAGLAGGLTVQFHLPLAVPRPRRRP